MAFLPQSALLRRLFLSVFVLQAAPLLAAEFDVELSLGSLYLDSTAHGYQETDLDGMTAGVSLLYPVNSQISVELGYQGIMKGFAKPVAGGDLTGGMWFSDVQLAMNLQRIRPYLSLGLGSFVLTPDTDSQTVVRMGLGVVNPLTQRLSLTASYTLMTASSPAGDSENITELGLRYRFSE